MIETQTSFQKRLGKVERTHKAMANGYVTKMRSDGLIVAKPKRKRSGIRLKVVMLFVLGLFAFKSMMFASLGEITYNERVAKLSNGTQLEQAGAWVMQSDPATEFLAGFIEILI